MEVVKKMSNEKVMTSQELASLIRKAGEKERVNEFEFPEISGFRVKLAYASKMLMSQIREVARVVRKNFRTGRIIEDFDEEKLRDAYANYIVKGWKGLTVDRLRECIPGIKITGKRGSEEIPYSVEVATALMDVSAEFENWIVEVAGDVHNYKDVAIKKKEQQENLD